MDLLVRIFENYFQYENQFKEIVAFNSNYYSIYKLPSSYFTIIGSFFSFILTIIFFIAAYYRREKFGMFINSGICFLGFTAIQVLLIFRNLLQPEGFLFFLHQALYLFVIPFAPTISLLFYYYFQKKMKTYFWMGVYLWIISIIGIVQIFRGEAFFADQWYTYSFGSFSVGKTAIRLWGISSAVCLLILIFRTWIYFYKNKTEEGKYLLYGILLTGILILLNLPSVMGIPIYPGGNFLAIPMVMIAYQLFKNDPFNLNEFLFDRNGLFFTLSGILGFGFLALSISTFTFLTPDFFSDQFKSFTSLIPFLSAFILLLLSVYISGVNPSSKINLYGAATIFISGIFMVNLCLHALDFNILVIRRMEQVVYSIFCFAPSVQMKFALKMLKLPYPKHTKYIDIVSVICSLLSQTPFLFKGFHYYSWGNSSESGPVVMLMSINGFVALLTVILSLKANYHKATTGAKFVVLGLVVGGLLLLLNLPATMGIPFYPLGSLQFIPGIIIAIGIGRYSAIDVNAAGLSISKKMSFLSFIFVPITVIILIPTLNSYSAVKIFIYLTYATLPLFLFLYTFTFVLTRPIALELDRNYLALLSEKLVVEKSQQEIKKLNELTKKINSRLSLPDVLSEMYLYLQNNFQVTDYRLYLLNKNKRRMDYVQGGSSEEENLDAESFLRANPFLIETKQGFAAAVYNTKRYIYLPRLKSSFLTEVEKKIVELFKINSIIIFPLMSSKDVTGILLFTRSENSKRLKKEEIQSMERFCDQITGAIQNATLMQQVEDSMLTAVREQYQAEIAQREAEEAKKIAFAEKEKSESLLLNILPSKIAQELKSHSEVEPVFYPSVTVLFTDFKGFTKLAENMTPQELVKELDGCFTQFDEICKRYNFEKLKTIGDSYMCAGGIPEQNKTHIIDACLTAIEIQSFMIQMREIKQILNLPFWELRLGIHTGPVVAGVVGKHKFAYDMWGDTVNIASRMESSGSVGEINVSQPVYEFAKYFFDFEPRGKLKAKNKEDMEMYYLKRIRKDLSKDPEGKLPDERFVKLYELLKEGKRFKFRKELRDE